MREPLVSIITPTYNHERYISDCIHSVVAQTYSNWEMIIVDDGSQDSTFLMASEIAKSESRIKVFTQENRGIFRLSETYNYALNIAKGEYIAVLEGDDIWFRNKLELQINELIRNPKAVLCWSRADILDNSTMQKQLLIAKNYDYDKSILTNTPLLSALRLLIFTNPIPALTVVIKKSDLEDIGGFLQPFNLPLVDLPTWQMLSTRGEFILIDKPLGYWRVSINQATKTFNIEMIEGLKVLAIQLLGSYKEFFKSNNITEIKIKNYFNSRLVVNHYLLGEYHLKRNNRDAAKAEFIKALYQKDFYKFHWKVKSIFKLMVIFFKSM